MKRKKKFPYSSYEEFEKTMLAFENCEDKPIFDIINVDPKDYPSPDTLTEKQVKRKYSKLKRKLEKNSYILEFSEQIPVLDAYRYLACTLLYEEDPAFVPKGYTSHINGCSGDCPDCFQLDYCEVKYDSWKDEDIKKEQERRRRETIQS